MYRMEVPGAFEAFSGVPKSPSREDLTSALDADNAELRLEAS